MHLGCKPKELAKESLLLLLCYGALMLSNDSMGEEFNSSLLLLILFHFFL